MSRSRLAALALVASGMAGLAGCDEAASGSAGEMTTHERPAPIDSNPAAQPTRATRYNRAFEAPSGWFYADGALSAPLPGNRTVWLFGDTWVRRNPVLLYNSIGVQNGTATPTPTDLRFYARRADGSVTDITDDGRTATRPWVQSATHDYPDDDPSKSWLWPGEPLVVEEQLVAIFVEVACVKETHPYCRGFMGNMGIQGYHLVRVENPEDPAAAWRVSTTRLGDARGRSPIDAKLHWGSALVAEDDWIYIFGASFVGERGAGGPDDAKLARARLADLGDYSAWQFLARSGWRRFEQGPTRDELRTIAPKVPLEYSVDPITRNGKTEYVLAHADLWHADVIVRRSPARSLADVSFGGPVQSERTSRDRLIRFDPEVTRGFTWAGRAHGNLSDDGKLLFSFYSEHLHRLRFVELPFEP